ncbi:TolC family protein [Terrimonas ferruginea]|uniref:TolC family protein n=1 Tax=Terrimonas ferruginea TaxID=249 RepID=UPI000685A6A8|nr:TolC family protein [Terrimonas ferruginea]
MMKKGSKGAWIMMLILLPALVWAQQPPATPPQVYSFSAQQAVDYGLKNNVQVKNALLQVQVQEQTNREVTGSAYPQISADGSLTYNAKLPVSLVPAEFFGGQPGEFAKVAFGLKWNSTYGVSFNQMLFDGQVFTGLQARKTLIDYNIKNVEVTEELIKANIYKIYYQLIVGQRQIQLLDSNIVVIRKLVSDNQIMYDNGFAEKLDVNRASVQLANVETERLNAGNQIANGFLALKVLMGMPIRDSIVLTDTINDQQLRDGVLEASAFDYSQRKEFQSADLGIRLQEYNVQRYKLSKIPTLSLNGYYNRNAQRDKFDFFKSDGDWFDISAFTLNLRIPIFSGFSTNARIARERLILRQNQNQREALKLDIDNEIRSATNNFNYAVANLDNQKKNMDLAQTVYDQTKKKYEVGTGSQTDINIAQNDLRLAQSNYINAMYNAITARIDFLKATGKL